MTNAHASEAAPQEAVKAVSDTIKGIATEVGEQSQELIRQVNHRYLAIHEANGRLILRIPLTIGLLGSISFLMLVPIRSALLLTFGALFARIYCAIEDR